VTDIATALDMGLGQDNKIAQLTQFAPDFPESMT
jgi:hypothetical protein